MEATESMSRSSLTVRAFVSPAGSFSSKR
jgi:hypothetical protein